MADLHYLSRRQLIGSAAVALSGATTGRASERRPNILLLMTDQQRRDTLACYGSRAAVTPNLDRLARSGTVFENCYADNPICTPSRASLMTGKTVPGHGVYRLYDDLPETEVLFSKWLQQAGYRTALIGKLHVSSRLREAATRHPNDGFDLYEWCEEDALHLDSPFNAYSRWLTKRNPSYLANLNKNGRKVKPVPADLHMTHWAAERTIEFLRNTDRSRPFFCMTSIFDPHDPYDRFPPAAAKLVSAGGIPARLADRSYMQHPYGVRYERTHGILGPFADLSEAQLRAMRFGYHAAIAFADSAFGRILQALDELDLTRNTLVVFTTDHGDMLGDHDLLAKGAFFYEPASRVPLVMRWPGVIQANERVRRIVQLHDIPATLLSAAGCFNSKVATAMPESRDLLQAAAGSFARLPEAVSCYRNSGIFSGGDYANPPIHATMLRQGRFKLNVYHTPESPSRHDEGQLFDLDTDPNEMTNLWSDSGHQAIRAELTGRLATWMLHCELSTGSRGGQTFPSGSQKVNNRL